MKKYQYFSPDDIRIVNNSVAMAEELVSNHYKLSSTQLLQLNYDVKTLADLSENDLMMVAIIGSTLKIIAEKAQLYENMMEGKQSNIQRN